VWRARVADVSEDRRVKLCMFRPEDVPMERGWPGRVDGEHVVQLAAQTLESFFTGGGTAREHAVYPLDAVRLLAPVLHPPSIRLFEDGATFAFANPAAIRGPGAAIAPPQPRDTVSRGTLLLLPRLAAVIGADEAVAGVTILAEWCDPGRPAPKRSDFALGLGPVVVTPDEPGGDGLAAVVRVDGETRLQERFGGFDWEAARALAADGTRLRPGDLLGAPSLAEVEAPAGSEVEVEVAGIGVLEQRVLRD
jgi:hypothetical protein